VNSRFFFLALLLVTPGPVLAGPNEETAMIFAEIHMPGFKGVPTHIAPDLLAEIHKFTAEELRPYADAAPVFADVLEEPKKYAARYPLRVAVVSAVAGVRKYEAGKFPDEFRDPIDDAVKRTIERRVQRAVAEMQSELEELDEKLTAAKKRGAETSKRWLAHADYVSAHLKLRLAECHEYNLALGKVRTDQLPDLDRKEGQNGWRLAPKAKLSAPKEYRDLADEAKAALAELAKKCPRTPWAALAEKQADMTLGLEWQPAALGKK
jgi:hypothetical protein